MTSQSPRPVTGNAAAASKNTRGWFLGHFIPGEDNPLHNAPHTSMQIAADWPHPYSREVAAFPGSGSRADKYWPPVRRIDQGYGDRNLMCSCPPLSAYEN